MANDHDEDSVPRAHRRSPVQGSSSRLTRLFSRTFNFCSLLTIIDGSSRTHNSHIEAAVVNGYIAHAENTGSAIAHTSARKAIVQHDTPRPALEIIPNSKADYDIYHDQLILRRRGFPLYSPGPLSSLPIEYRSTGTRIGDIGIVYRSGFFDYLFNILHPWAHPINSGRVPPDFKHFDIPLEDAGGQVSGPDSFLASGCTRKRSSGNGGALDSDFIFETTSDEGAVLVLPTGSCYKDLLNKDCLKDYIAENAGQWYSYINGPRRGRGVRNGDIRLVVGFDKALSWGIATFAGPGCLEFKRSIRVWHCPEGTGNGKSGPQDNEILDIRQLTDEPNQTIFIRTMNFTLKGEIPNNPDLVALEARSGSSGMEDPSSSFLSQRDSSQRPAGSSVGPSSGVRGPQAGQQRGVNFLPAHFDHPVAHPSTYLNQLLLDKYPNAKIAITDDSDWISVIHKDDFVFPSPNDLCQRIKQACQFSEENGIATISMNGDNPSLSVAVELSESKRVDNSVITRSNELHQGSTRKSNESLDKFDAASHIAQPHQTYLTHDISKSYDRSGFPSGGLGISTRSCEEGELGFGLTSCNSTRLDSSSWPRLSANSTATLSIPHSMQSTSRDKSSRRASTLWSSDAATSMTSLSSGRSHALELDLEIPYHSVSLATGTFSQRSRSASKPPTIANSDQGVLWQTSEISRQISAIHTSSTQDLYAGPSDQATFASVVHDQGKLAQVTRTDSQNDPIEQAIQSRLPTFYFENGVVTSGTLEGLIQFLITGFDLPGHTYYRDTFLTACSELTTPGDLFQILSRRLAEMPTSNDGFATQHTIFLVIIYWLKSDIFPPKDELLYRIKVFCEDAVRLYPVAIETCQLIDLKVTRPTTIRASNPDEPILKSSQIKPFGLAIALSLLEGDHYKGLQASDYLLQLSKGQSERIQNYRETNEKVCLWVIKSILHYDTASGRSEVMKFFTYTALECYSMRNFSSTVAILNAFHSVLIEELKATTRATRKALPKRIQAKLPSLYDIINPQSNHRGYRDAIQSAATVAERDICIPWLPVHLMELKQVFRYQPLTVQVDGQHLVNFDRYNRFMERTKEILHYSPPDLEEKRHGGQLTYLLDQLRDIDLSGNLEQRLVERSRTLSAQELTIHYANPPSRFAPLKFP